jgi:death-on-curing protein
VIYLTYVELLHVAERAMGVAPRVRDAGLLESAAGRPGTSVFGDAVYPSIAEKAAALTHSILRNHALVDGNKRLALAGLIAFLGVNGRRLTLDNDEAYELILAISTGALDEVSEIAARIDAASEAR